MKFEESKDIYRQMSAFADTFGISKKEIAANWELVEWLKNGTRINAAEAVKTGILHWKEAGLPYIWGNLDDKWNLKDKAVLAAIGVFGTFVIYSLFQVSVRKRMSQYSVMQTLGMESKCTFGVLTSELWMILQWLIRLDVFSEMQQHGGFIRKSAVFLYGQREFSIRICMSQQRRPERLHRQDVHRRAHFRFQERRFSLERSFCCACLHL